MPTGVPACAASQWRPCGRPRCRRVPLPALCLGRQPLFRGAVQNAEVQARFPCPLRLHRGCPQPLPTVLPVVQPPVPLPLGHRLHEPRPPYTSVRPERCTWHARKLWRPPSSPIQSDSKANAPRQIFSNNVVPKQRMFSVPVIYVLGPLQVDQNSCYCY